VVNRVIVHYHEIALKQRNRPFFVERLKRNIEGVLRGTGAGPVRRAEGRIVVHLPEEAQWPLVRERLGYVPGIANFLPARASERSVEALIASSLAMLRGRHASRFAVRCKRADKSYPLPSPEVCRQVGAAVQREFGWKVDLEEPEIELRIEILAREAFVAVEQFPGLGGLPVGSSGRVVALLSGGIDSPVAAWRMMRRGCPVEFVHFHGAPYQDRSSRDKAIELVRLLTRYQLRSHLHVVRFGEIQRQIVTAVARPYRVVLYRRMMVRIAAALAEARGALALVTGESLGQVASQTLENLVVIDDAVTMPILRPLVGMDKLEIRTQAEAIGTYEISIQPDQDCCQLFVPKLPATHMTVEQARAAEAALDLAAMLAQAREECETLSFAYPENGDRPASGRSQERGERNEERGARGEK